MQATAPVVNVFNNAPGVRVETSQGDDGETNIRVMENRIVEAITRGGNRVARAFEKTYSLGRV